MASLLHDQDEGKTEKIAYSPEQTTADVVNDSEINGLAAAVSEVLSAKGFAAGDVGNNDKDHVIKSQVQAAKTDDLGAQAVAKELGGLPVVADGVDPGGHRAGGAGVGLHRARLGPGRHAADGGDGEPGCGTGRRRGPTPAVADHHRGVRRPQVRQLMNLADAVLDPLLRADPMGPRITYYDDATGERIELSTVTLANWAAKTANLLRDELGAGPGTRVAVLLPAHWQTAAVLLGVWWIGAEVVLSGSRGRRVVHVRPARRGRRGRRPAARWRCCRWIRSASPAPDLPIGVTDYATAVRVHGDQVVAEQRPGPALAGRTVADVLAAARDSAATQGFSPADRVMSSAAWSTPDEVVDNLLAVFVAGASLVQVANPDPALTARRRETEKVTRKIE